MSPEPGTVDRGDPGVRAGDRLARARRRDRRRRLIAAGALVAAASAAVALAQPLTGSPGATLGAVVGGLAMLAIAVAIAPHEWADAEARHHELESLWRELRSDADREVPHRRFAAWAAPHGQEVRLSTLERSPSGHRLHGAPSPYTLTHEQTFDADSLAAAADAMEQLRAKAAGREEASRAAHQRKLLLDERRAHERRLHDVEAETATYAAEREAELRRRDEERFAAEREAQAEALARALRRG
jgi:hypothetical protein